MDLILPPGTRLFHGTSEEFPTADIRGGGYDGVIWTADNSAIAQNYIPMQGGTTYTNARTISRPSKDLCVQAIQEIIGLRYDYFGVEWDYMDTAKSFYLPEGWTTFPEPEDIVEMMAAVGFETEDVGYQAYALRTKYMRDERGELYSHLFMPGEKLMGRLFIFDAQEPIRIYDYTFGGERESDLMNVDYHNTKLFRKVEAAGYDGIKINDFAQSKYWGNVGHTSIGLFRQTLDRGKFTWAAIPAVNFDWDDDTPSDETMTPEYKEFVRKSTPKNRRYNPSPYHQNLHNPDPKCDMCWDENCQCDPNYLRWLKEISNILYALVGITREELPADYMWADTYDAGFSPLEAVNILVGPTDNPDDLLEAIYLDGSGLSELGRKYKLSKDQILDIAEDILRDELDRDRRPPQP